MQRHLLFPLLTLPLLLTGCGSDVEKDAEYANTIQLRTAMREAGHDCPGQHQEESEDDEATVQFVLKCDSELILETANKDVDNLEGWVNIARELTDLPSTLIGPNWVITSQDMNRLVAIQEDLGGRIAAE